MANEVYTFLSEFINQGNYMQIARESHEIWRETKQDQGWRYGRRKDEQQKRHPKMVPFEDLSARERISNGLSPYAVVNFLRTNFGDLSLKELKGILLDLLDGEPPEIFDALGEYVHSHFIANLIARSETVETRQDMVVYEDLSAEVQSWDLVIAEKVIEFLLDEIETALK